MLDRLLLTPARIAGMAQGIREVAALPDPVGAVLEEYKRAGDSYTKLIYMMEKLGYRPSEEELLAAGLTRDQARAFLG